MGLRELSIRTCVVLFALAVACVPARVFAQESIGDEETGEKTSPSEETGDVDESEFVTPTDKQADLNRDAVEAITKEKYDKAVDLLRQSLEISEINITYLNLGRAHQRLEECGAAEDAYLEALSAPPVESPSPFLVEKKIEQYMGELEEECEEGDWEKTETGAEDDQPGYSWTSEPAANAPMIRFGVGIGTSASVVISDTAPFTVGGESFDEYNYGGAALKLAGTGGYFINQNLVVHGSFVVHYVLSPTIDFIGNDVSATDARLDEDPPNALALSRLTAGVTGYVPGDIFLEGGLGVGFGGVDDPFADFTIEPGFALDVMIGKDIQLSDDFALGFGAYLDIILNNTDRELSLSSAVLGLQTHGIVKFR